MVYVVAVARDLLHSLRQAGFEGIEGLFMEGEFLPRVSEEGEGRERKGEGDILRERVKEGARE